MLLKLLITLFLFAPPIMEPEETAVAPYITFSFQDKEWTLTLSDVGFDGIDPTTLDRQAFRSWLSLVVEKEVNKAPRSATFQERKLIPHQLGRKVDRQKIENLLDHIHQYMNKRLELPIIYTEPILSTEKAMRLKEKRLGFYQTFFNPKKISRAQNIYLSSKAIDHYILMPNETFSFNQVVGIRTIQRGYRIATIIVKGKYSEGIGGGICQTSSTLFNSVDRAGLKIVERVSHSKEVGYVPKNRDATVSWGGPDFRFTNQLSEPILIVSTVKGGVLTVSIYGPSTITDPSRTRF